MINWRGLPMLLVSVLLCFAGAFRLHDVEGGADGYALLTAGIVTLGAWLALETLGSASQIDIHHRRALEEEDDEEDDDGEA